MRLRGREEIQGSLQAFKDVYENQFDKPLDNQRAIEIITQMLSRKELESIQQRFFDFHPQDLKTVIELLQPVEKPVEIQEKPKRGRPKNDKR